MEEKLTYAEFAAKIKEKYPQYSDMDDMELAKKIVDKYPDYGESVIFEDVKKKDTIGSESLAEH